jgi:pimeloyl-ACP methyl ester carboxylesterase
VRAGTIIVSLLGDNRMTISQFDTSRRSVIAGAVGLSLAAGLPASAATQQESRMSSSKKPGIVFAHGLWADGSCFQKVVPALQADGHDVICSQHGLDSLKSDVDCVTRCFGRVNGPIVLVGHSYGGTLITHAGVDKRVAALVYIAALAPDESETSQGQQNKFPKTDVFKEIEVADGRIWLKPAGTRYFCGDLSETDQKLVWATQSVPVPDLFDQKHDGVAWHSKPSWYIIGAEDHTVNPLLQRAAAKRMDAKVTELKSSHVPMLSQPDAVLDVIRSAAKAVSA